MKQFIVKLEALLALVYSLALSLARSLESWLYLNSIPPSPFHFDLPQNETFHSICDCSIFKKNEIRILLLPHFFCFFCMRSAPRAKWVKFRFFCILFVQLNIDYWTVANCDGRLQCMRASPHTVNSIQTWCDRFNSFR